MIQDRTFTISALNRAGLDTTLRDQLGTRYAGFSDQLTAEGHRVTVYIHGDIDDNLYQQLSQHLTNHDAAALTPEQQAEVTRQRHLNESRAAQHITLDLSTYKDESVQLRQLAEKIIWLEQEILALRPPIIE